VYLQSERFFSITFYNFLPKIVNNIQVSVFCSSQLLRSLCVSPHICVCLFTFSVLICSLSPVFACNLCLRCCPALQ
jgi:hypothetical protein